jgi:hypothetical protein
VKNIPLDIGGIFKDILDEARIAVLCDSRQRPSQVIYSQGLKLWKTMRQSQPLKAAIAKLTSASPETRNRALMPELEGHSPQLDVRLAAHAYLAMLRKAADAQLFNAVFDIEAARACLADVHRKASESVGSRLRDEAHQLFKSMLQSLLGDYARSSFVKVRTRD